MLRLLKNIPFYVLLLPVFFVWHGFAENTGILQFGDIAVVGAIYMAAAIVLFLLCRLLFKNTQKAALLTTCCLGIYFFFGAVFDLLKAHAPFAFLYKYSFLMTAIVVILLVVAWLLKRSKRSFAQLSLFLNSLLLIYLLVDTFNIIRYKVTPTPGSLYTKLNMIQPGISKPDIYLLLFDEYASSQSLQQRYHFHNDLDSFLVTKGFATIPAAKSNYNYTAFSMASMLNMRYLQVPNNRYTWDQYTECLRLINDNATVRFLELNGYDIVNLSIFDLAKHPTPVEQSFLPLQTRLVTENTLSSRLIRDFRWFFANNKILSALTGTTTLTGESGYNMKVIEEVRKTAATPSAKPRFVYAHIYMPHAPFLYDSHGNKRDAGTAFKKSAAFKPENYLEYVLYTNTYIKQLVTELQQQTHHNAAILVMGDHGFRLGDDRTYCFSNFNAVYLPNKDYHTLYDSMTCVNQFPAIFNSLFKQQWTMQKDSSIYLTSDAPDALP